MFVKLYPIKKTQTPKGQVSTSNLDNYIVIGLTEVFWFSEGKREYYDLTYHEQHRTNSQQIN